MFIDARDIRLPTSPPPFPYTAASSFNPPSGRKADGPGDANNLSQGEAACLAIAAEEVEIAKYL